MNSSQRINFMEINLHCLIDGQFFENADPFMGRVGVRVDLQLKRILEDYLHQVPLKRKGGAKNQASGWAWGAHMKKLLKWLVQLGGFKLEARHRG